jgi:redox-sensitive bicupin YhaK (pirin superfamily)
MRLRSSIAIAVLAAVTAVGVAGASHVSQVDPATVPTGFLAAHNHVADLPLLPLLRIALEARREGADVFVQHARLGPNAATPWHTHPGPAIVTVVSGALTYQDAARHQGECRAVRYPAGTGFVDSGFGHVHRAFTESEGADFYVTYILPRGSENHLIEASAPCTP